MSTQRPLQVMKFIGQGAQTPAMQVVPFPQTIPHLLQLFASEVRSVHWPLHTIWLPGQGSQIWPLAQNEFGAQQAPLQTALPLGHEQLPPTQSKFAPQAWPQLPQFCLSWSTEMQVLLQKVKPLPQVQVPAMHCAVPQSVLQSPQC